MSFEKLYKRNVLATLSATERKDIHVLVVESQFNIKNSLRQTLSSLGFANVTDASDHAQALQKLEQRGITHIIFEAKKTTMPVKEFLSKALTQDPKIVAVPSSFEPSVDDVFDLLIIGARGYIVKPFTSDSLDDALVQATKGEPISDSILHAKDRNEALAAFVVTALDKFATITRQAQQFETARVELPRLAMALRRAVEIGRLFALGGEEALRDSVIEMCLERSHGPASRLGRLRKRLGTKKAGEPDDATEIDPAVVNAE